MCRPGDEVVLATPCFPPSRDAFDACGLSVITAPLLFDEGYRLNPDLLAKSLSPATRLVSVASPQNPSGVRLDHDDLRRLLDLMTERAPKALLFVDEAYRAAVYGDADIPSSAAGWIPASSSGDPCPKPMARPV